MAQSTKSMYSFSSYGSSRDSRSSSKSMIGTKSNTAEPVIKNADMDEDMKESALRIAQDAVMKFDLEKELASYIKKEFDKEFDPTWHCVVGKHFASYVTHEAKNFIYFYIKNMGYLLWKSG